MTVDLGTTRIFVEWEMQYAARAATHHRSLPRVARTAGD